MYVNSTWHRKNRLSSHNGVYTVRIYINNTTCVWPRGIHKGLYSISRDKNPFMKKIWCTVWSFSETLYVFSVCLSFVYLYVGLIVSLSIRLFVCLSICLFVCRSLCLFVDLSVRQYVCLLVFLGLCLSKNIHICLQIVCQLSASLFVCLSVYFPACLSVYLSIFLPVCLSVWSFCLFFCLSTCPSFCLSVCLIFLPLFLSVYLPIFLPVCLSDLSASLPVCVLLAGENCARNYRPCFRENQPKRSFSIKWKRAFLGCFRENWVHKFGHWCDVSRSLVGGGGMGGGGLSPALLIAVGNWSRNLVLIKSREGDKTRLWTEGRQRESERSNCRTCRLFQGWLVLVL